MRWWFLIAGFVLAMSTAAWAQAPLTFDDVAPWHWALDAVQRTVAAGIFIGYPSDDRDLAANAVEQVYDSFVHPTHPQAREWAERFLTDIPANWPQPLQRSPLLRFTLDNVRVVIAGEQGTVSFAAATTIRTAGGPSTARTSLRVEVKRDTAGRWRVSYGALVLGQPQVFK